MLNKIYFYEKISCPESKKYFQDGLRKGYFIEFIRKNNHAYVEYSPLLGITTDDNQEYLLTRAYLYLFFCKISLNKKIFIQQSALITDLNIDNTCNQAIGFVKQGYKCLKIKISNNIEYEIKRINTLAKLTNYKINLRIDANKSLTYQQAYIFLTNCPPIIEYIEDPLINNINCYKLFTNTNINIAFDESFNDLNSMYFMKENNVKYLVVKTNRFNNLFTLIKTVKKAINMGIIPIFSTCFESEFTASLTTMIIVYLNLQNYTHCIHANNYSLSLWDKDLFSVTVNCEKVHNFLKKFKLTNLGNKYFSF